MTPRIHSLWLFCHRWIGLLLGLAIALIGLSGSIIVFEETIDTALHPELHVVNPRKVMMPFGDLAAAAMRAEPNKRLLFLARNNDERHTSIYATMADRDGERTQVFLGPYSGKHLGSRPERTWLGAVHQFHGELLLGPAGQKIVGSLAFVFVLSLIGGLVLWWPEKGEWKRALTVKKDGTRKRFLRDLHNVTGTYFFVVLFVCSLTTLPLIWPAETKTVLSTVLGDPPAQQSRQSTILEDGSRITLNDAVEIARAEFPGMWVNLALNPRGQRGFYMVRQVPQGETRMSKSKSLLLDQYSGEVLAVLDPSQQHIVESLASDFAGTIHNGSILGLPGRWLVLIAGLAFPVLFVTGFMLWVRGEVSKDVVSALRSGKPRRKP